jgi:hypothetical protein
MTPGCDMFSAMYLELGLRQRYHYPVLKYHPLRPPTCFQINHKALHLSNIHSITVNLLLQT